MCPSFNVKASKPWLAFPGNQPRGQALCSYASHELPGGSLSLENHAPAPWQSHGNALLVAMGSCAVSQASNWAHGRLISARLTNGMVNIPTAKVNGCQRLGSQNDQYHCHHHVVGTVAIPNQSDLKMATFGGWVPNNLSKDHGLS